MRTRPLRLPQKLSFTALGVAVAGAVACSAGETRNVADAHEDGPAVADGGPIDDCSTPMLSCVPLNGASPDACPQNLICDPAECPDAACGLEPIA
jgi:hypothetical protein